MSGSEFAVQLAVRFKVAPDTDCTKTNAHPKNRTAVTICNLFFLEKDTLFITNPPPFYF
jgi:hypothetical protein